MYLSAIRPAYMLMRQTPQSYGSRAQAAMVAANIARVAASDPWGNRARAERAAANRRAMGLHGLSAATPTTVQPSGILREVAKHAEQANKRLEAGYRSETQGQGKLTASYMHDELSQRGGYKPWEDPAFRARQQKSIDRSKGPDVIAANKEQIEKREAFYAAEKVAGRDPYANIRGGFDLTPRFSDPSGKALRRYEQLRDQGYNYAETTKLMKAEGSTYKPPPDPGKALFERLRMQGVGGGTIHDIMVKSGYVPRGPTEGERVAREREALAIRARRG